MSTSYINSNQNINPTVQEKEQIHEQQNQDALLYAFFMILQTANIQQETAQTQAKALQANALDQAKLNNQAAQLNFEQIPWSLLYQHKTFKASQFLKMVKKLNTKNMTTHEMTKVQQWLKSIFKGSKKDFQVTFRKTLKPTMLEKLTTSNQQVEKERTVISNQVMMTQQTGQVLSTQLSASANNDSASLQICSSLMQMLQQLTTQIDR